MKRIPTLCLALAVFAVPLAQAKDEPQQDGVKVGKPSVFTKLAPAGYIENQALQQYQGLKVAASQRGVLVPEKDPEVQRLRRIAKEIIPHTQRWNPRANEWKWEVNLIASNQINAFCMPGGKIAFYTGILKSLKLTDDEVAMIMGHEIAHALREHARERLGKGAAVQLGAAITAHVLKQGQAGQYATDMGARLLTLTFSRANETDADLVGLDIAARAGYDPRAGVALWQKMGLINKKAPPQWLSTHPAGENRIKEIRKHLPDVMPLYAKSKGKTVKELEAYKSNVAAIAPIS